MWYLKNKRKISLILASSLELRIYSRPVVVKAGMHQNHLEILNLLRTQIAALIPSVSGSAGLGWTLRTFFSYKFKCICLLGWMSQKTKTGYPEQKKLISLTVLEARSWRPRVEFSEASCWLANGCSLLPLLTLFPLHLCSLSVSSCSKFPFLIRTWVRLN